MSAELIGILGVGVAISGMLVGLATLGWRMVARIEDRLEGKIDRLAESHQALAREFSEFRGEMRTYFRHAPATGD